MTHTGRHFSGELYPQLVARHAAAGHPLHRPKQSRRRITGTLDPTPEALTVEIPIVGRHRRDDPDTQSGGGDEPTVEIIGMVAAADLVQPADDLAVVDEWTGALRTLPSEVPTVETAIDEFNDEPTVDGIELTDQVSGDLDGDLISLGEVDLMSAKLAGDEPVLYEIPDGVLDDALWQSVLAAYREGDADERLDAVPLQLPGAHLLRIDQLPEYLGVPESMLRSVKHVSPVITGSALANPAPIPRQAATHVMSAMTGLNDSVFDDFPTQPIRRVPAGMRG